MSLIVNEGAGQPIPLLPEDVYPAVCCMLVDLGEQYSEKFGNTARKVLISWELPDEKLENGETRRLSNTYTASLNSKGNLRKDLISWRGRDFTVDELKKFDLRNIVGAPCMLSVVHKVGQDGTKRAVIGGIMKLPKGMKVPALTNGFTIFDLDEEGADVAINELPEWIQNRIMESETWKNRQADIDEREYAKAEQAAVSEERAAEPAPAQEESDFFKEINGSDAVAPF